MTVYIITGTTKGIGKSLKDYVIKNSQDVVIGLSRADAVDSPQWINMTCDMVEPDEQVLKAAFEKATSLKPSKVVLINNAGQLSPIAKMGDCEPTLLKSSISVNLTAPLILINAFIHYTKLFDIEKVIVNISSGAAHSPYSGWSAYCSSKAGLDMLTKTVAAENHPNVSIMSVAPGVVDTGMQNQIRETSKSDFEMVDKFHQLKNEGHLYTTTFVAEKMIGFIRDAEIVSGGIYDLREM